jgi:hypothetical protein
MRADAHQLQYFVIELAVEQYQVRLDMTITMVFPVASERMVAAAVIGRRPRLL